MWGVLVFITKKTMVEMFKLSKTSLNKLLAKPTKKKEKEKEVVVYQKITPLEAFVNHEG
jgi:hypothetical protein